MTTANLTVISLDDPDTNTDYCNDCGLLFPDAMIDSDGYCSECAAKAAAELAAEEAREAAQSEMDEAEEDLASLLEEAAELAKQITYARERRRVAKNELAKLG